jgi:hypothetical protein
MWVAAGILAAFFTKTNYGVLLMLVFAIDALIDASYSPRRLLTRRNGYVVVPIAIVFAVWFAYPPKLVSTIGAMVNKPAGASPWTLDGVLFYPRTLVTFAGSWPMLLATLAAVAIMWSRRREPNVRLLFILAVVQFILGQLHHTKEDRHLLPIFPAMVLLSAAAIARVMSDARTAARSRRTVWAFAAATVVGIVLQGVAVVSRPLPTWRRRPTVPLAEPNQVLRDFIGRARADGERVLLIGTVDLAPGPPVTDWDLVVHYRYLAIEHSGAIGVFDRDRAVAASLARSPLPRWVSQPVVRVLARGDGPATVRSMYAGLPERLDSIEFARSVTASIAATRPTMVIIASALGAGASYGPGYFAPAIAQASLRRVESREISGRYGWRIETYRPH